MTEKTENLALVETVLLGSSVYLTGPQYLSGHGLFKYKFSLPLFCYLPSSFSLFIEEIC